MYKKNRLEQLSKIKNNIPFIPIKDDFLPFMSPGGSSSRFIVHQVLLSNI